MANTVRGGAFLIQAVTGSVMIGGPLLVAVGLVYLSQITADGDYFVQVLPVLVLMGFGMGFVFVPLQSLALSGVAPHDAGAASATANSAMQIGGSIGLSILTAIYAATAGATSGLTGTPLLEAFTSGYSATFLAAAVGMVLASVIAAVFIRGPKAELLPQGDAAALVHVG